MYLKVLLILVLLPSISYAGRWQALISSVVAVETTKHMMPKSVNLGPPVVDLGAEYVQVCGPDGCTYQLVPKVEPASEMEHHSDMGDQPRRRRLFRRRRTSSM